MSDYKAADDDMAVGLELVGELKERIEELEEENKRLEYEIGELRMYFSRLPKEHFEAFRKAGSDE